MTENAPPGWYQAETDPPGTERYWDGGRWTEETRAALAPPPAVSGAARMTPQGRELASPGARIGARLIDLILLAILLVPIVTRGLDLDQATFGTTSVSSSRLLAAGLIGAAYEIILVGWKSATLGKMAVGLEVVRKVDGQAPVGFPVAAMRWLPFAVGYIPGISSLSTLVLLASLILIFVDDHRRSVYDFAGQTYVVRKPRRV